jgi:Cys-tRNA(Pro)/Cys-tRNA(Cys) deacylase
MNKIAKLLSACPYDYELISHPQPINTVNEGTKYFKIEAGQTAPTLILKADDNYYVLIFSGSQKRLDFLVIASIIGCNQMKLASPAEVEKITGFTIGSIPMIGHSLPCVLDNKLLNYSFVFGGTGNPLITLKISPKALPLLNNVIAYINTEIA